MSRGRGSVTNCTCTGATFRFIITRGQVGTSAPEMRKGLCCPNRSERVLRISFARKLSSTIASRERAQKFSDPSRAISELARFIPFRFEYLGRGDEALFDRDQKKKKRKNGRFLSQLVHAQRVMNTRGRNSIYTI